MPMHREHLVVLAVMAMGVDLGMVAAHFIIYSHSMSMMPSWYIADVPGFGWLFGNSDAQVSHVVAAVTAVASVATPVIGFYYLMRENIVAQPGAFFSYIPNRITFGLLAAFWFVMVTVEVLNVMALVDAYFNDPLRQHDGILGALPKSQALTFLFSVVVTIVNQAIGLFSAVIYRKVFSQENAQ